MQNELHTRMYGDAYGNHTGPQQYQNMTTATNLSKKSAPVIETPAQRRERWAHMTPEQIMRATPDADVIKFARRGAPMAIAELERREHRESMKFPLPDPELDLGV